MQKSRHGRLASGQSPSASGLQERGDKRDQSWKSLSSASPKAPSAEEEGGRVTDAWPEVGETPAGGTGGCLSWRLLAGAGEANPALGAASLSEGAEGLQAEQRGGRCGGTAGSQACLSALLKHRQRLVQGFKLEPVLRYFKGTVILRPGS